MDSLQFVTEVQSALRKVLWIEAKCARGGAWRRRPGQWSQIHARHHRPQSSFRCNWYAHPLVSCSGGAFAAEDASRRRTFGRRYARHVGFERQLTCNVVRMCITPLALQDSAQLTCTAIDYSLLSVRVKEVSFCTIVQPANQVVEMLSSVAPRSTIRSTRASHSNALVFSQRRSTVVVRAATAEGVQAATSDTDAKVCSLAHQLFPQCSIAIP
jgi:hypothetical protein